MPCHNKSGQPIAPSFAPLPRKTHARKEKAEISIFLDFKVNCVFEREKKVESPRAIGEFGYLRRWVPIALLIGGGLRSGKYCFQ